MIFDVNYLYRDASNYKQYVSVVVDVSEVKCTEDVEALILSRFADLQVWPDVVHFRPEDLGWPTAYFDDHDEAGEDVYLHEIEAIATTRKPVTAILPKNKIW